MKAKEYLQQLKRLDTVINQKIKELEDLCAKYSGISGIDYSKGKIQTNPSGEASFVKMTDRKVDLEAEIRTEIDNFVNEKHKIINRIQALKNTDHINLLFKRYVEFKKFEVIAIEMNFTYQYVLELHGYALKAFEETYKNL